MKWYFFFAAVLLLPACFKISHDAQNLYLRIDLPSKNADGTPIDDLFEMVVVMNVDGKVKEYSYRAEPITGGISIYPTIPMAATSYTRIEAYVYAVDFSGNKSEHSDTATVLGTKPTPSPSPL